MKRLLLFITLILLIVPVYAKESKLYFTDSGDRLYYDSNSLRKDVFMYHDDMLPGGNYVDELIIENGSKTDYTLFFKINEVAEQSIEANELLDNITMKIYLNDKLIYEGYAKGKDYTDMGIDLQDAIILGKFEVGEESLLRVETSLLPEYSNIENSEESRIDWEFYAYYKDKLTEILPNPDTNDDMKSYLVLLVVPFILIVVAIIMLVVKNLNKKENE